MEYDDKLIESLKCQAQRLRRDVVISMGVGVAGQHGKIEKIVKPNRKLLKS